MISSLRQQATADCASLADGTADRSSYAKYLHRLDSVGRASQYPTAFNNSLRQQCERRTLKKLIAMIPDRSHVLDLPCGTGRVTRLILEEGHRVIAGDSAAQMLALAERELSVPFPGTDFRLMEAADTGIPDKCVDAIICNRLFHHFSESAVRISVLREFARISRELVIVSFSNSFGLDVTWQRLTRWVQRRALRHYFPISMEMFQSEFAEAGLSIVATRSVMWGLSRMWYVVGSSQVDETSAADDACSTGESRTAIIS